MLSRKMLKILVSCIVMATLVAVPMTVNFSNAITFASENERVYEQPLETVTFISSSDIKEEVGKITTSKNDESLENIKKNVKSKGLKVNVVKFNGDSTISDSGLGGTNGLAVNVKDIRKSQTLGKFLNGALTSGKKVYLYGGLKPSEYKKLLNLKEMKIKDKNGTSEFGLTKSEMNSRKTTSSDDEFDMNTSIVGYSLDGEYHEIDVTIVDEVGNPRENDEEVYIQEILNLESEKVDKQIKEHQQQASLITESKESAANVEVKRGYDFIGSVYDSANRIIGRLTTDYYLYKESNDNYASIDYATLKPVTQIDRFNGAQARKLVNRIEVFSDDEMDEWIPEGDTSTTSYNISLGYPYAINVGMSFSDALSVDDQGSRYFDYAQWSITDGELHGTVWRGAAGFMSVGTYIYAKVANTGTVNIGSSNQYPVSWSKSFYVSYDY